MDITKSQSLTCRIIILFLLGIFSIRAIAQQKIDASSIIEDLKIGKSVTYTDAIITGDLDFTFMDEKLPDLPTRSKWRNNGGDNSVEESISQNIYFKNCVFEGNVLAYIHHEASGYTFIAHFDGEVTFEGCKFNENAMFKYSEFDRKASFSKSKFLNESTFKYAEFDEYGDFSETYFERDATFKYAQFDAGVSFSNTTFDESWNIKYLKASGDFDIKGLEVNDDVDAKYTRINGRSFSSYLISSRD